MAGSSGGGGVPPGFRFHPTDEELLHFYLKKKISFQKFDMEVIREVDLNKIEPWELQERCKIGSTPQNEWYFFSHKDRKYPTGSRTNRATSAGFWKATGRDKCIRNSFKKMGMRKTLVFYRGRAPHGQKTDWIMHEYRLEEDSDHKPTHEDGWVICRVFKKKNLFKIGTSTSTSGHADDQVNMSATSTSMNPHQYLNYSHHIPLPPHRHQYTTAQVEAAQNHNTIKPLMMLSSPNSTCDHHLSTTDNYNNDDQPAVMGSHNMQVKQFMSSSTRDHDHCESAATGYQCDRYSSMDAHQNFNEWDRLTNPTTSININQLSLRSTDIQDFWAYGK